jgi:hypothetical protein
VATSERSVILPPLCDVLLIFQQQAAVKSEAAADLWKTARMSRNFANAVRRDIDISNLTNKPLNFRPSDRSRRVSAPLWSRGKKGPLAQTSGPSLGRERPIRGIARFSIGDAAQAAHQNRDRGLYCL